MCLYPRLINNKKYTMNKKNGGVIPAVSDKRVLLVAVGCGNCIECRKRKAREWNIRLQQEVKDNRNGKFVTFTFSDEEFYKLATEKDTKDLSGYTLDNAVATKAVRRFLERWRKKFKKSVRHWFVTELGHKGTENVHLHGIIWTDESIQEIRDKWKYGFIWAGYENRPTYVNEKTINYITKYILKFDKDHREYVPKVFASPGIGRGYTETENFKRHVYKGDKTITTYKLSSGAEVALPIYYRNKAFTEDEREKLWLHLLDRKERYILGERIDVSTDEGMQEYHETLKFYQMQNEAWGFGSGEKNWERKLYENQLRRLKHKERIRKGMAKEKASTVGKCKKE